MLNKPCCKTNDTQKIDFLLCVRLQMQIILCFRQIMYELRVTAEHLSNKPQCPGFVRNLVLKSVAFISRLAPQTQPAPAN